MTVYGKKDDQGRIVHLALDYELDEDELNHHPWVPIGKINQNDAQQEKKVASVYSGSFLGKELLAAGVPRYKVSDDGLVSECTKQEMASYVTSVPPPTLLDEIQSQLAYTAMMTDTLLEV